MAETLARLPRMNSTIGEVIRCSDPNGYRIRYASTYIFGSSAPTTKLSRAILHIINIAKRSTITCFAAMGFDACYLAWIPRFRAVFDGFQPFPCMIGRFVQGPAQQRTRALMKGKSKELIEQSLPSLQNSGRGSAAREPLQVSTGLAFMMLRGDNVSCLPYERNSEENYAHF